MFSLLKNIKYVVLGLIIWGVCTTPLYAQSTSTNSYQYTVDEFIAAVKQNNPIAKIADIQTDKALAELQSARGAFDPNLKYSAAAKTFNGTDYYHYNNPELVIPTPIGVDIKTGLEKNSGTYTNPELTKGASSYIGLEVSVLKGLLIDSRRAALQQAKIFVTQSQQERLKIVNDLLYDAYSDYWKWTGAYELFKVYEEYTDIASKRLKLIKTLYENGNVALADTVEAATQLQSYQLQRETARLALENAQLILSNYLWTENQQAFQLPSNYVPQSQLLREIQLLEGKESYVNQSNNSNPNLLTYNFKLKSLQVEQKLKFQSLLPSLKLKGNILSKDDYQFPNNINPYLENNYKWGVEFSMPLLFREARGAYRKAKLKVQETQLEFQNKTRETENKIRYYHTTVETLQKQIQINQNAYQNYMFMLKNENLKFNNGESSLFLINSRESKLLSSLEKQIELYTKHQQSQVALKWATGALN